MGFRLDGGGSELPGVPGIGVRRNGKRGLQGRASLAHVTDVGRALGTGGRTEGHTPAVENVFHHLLRGRVRLDVIEGKLEVPPLDLRLGGHGGTPGRVQGLLHDPVQLAPPG